MRKSASLLVVVIAALVLFGSCVSNGANTNQKNSLMVIYTERPPIDTSELYVFFNMKGDGFEFKIDPKKLFQQINLMQPGSYAVRTAEAVYYYDNSRAGSFSMPFTFELKENTVTILPLKLVTRMIRNNEGEYVQSIAFDVLKPEELSKTKEFIAGNKRYAGLAVELATLTK